MTDNEATANPAPRSSSESKVRAYWKKLRTKPLFLLSISIVQVLVFLVSLTLNRPLTGFPIRIRLSVSGLIGPSLPVLIIMGASFSPCMKAIPGITSDIQYPLPCRDFSGEGDVVLCTLNQLCSTVWPQSQNQWYRFVVATFLHFGLAPLLVNVVLQVTCGFLVEKKFGTLRTLVIYFVSGIFSVAVNISFSGNRRDIVVGCSAPAGAVLALYVYIRMRRWKSYSWALLALISIDLVGSLILGFLRSFNNCWMHVSSFTMGFLLGVTLLKHPRRFAGRKRSRLDRLLGHKQGKVQRYFSYRRPMWWIWWMVRVVCLSTAILLFVLVLKKFYFD